ncbi:alpha/beta-hydrolase [Thozetella sp. PMI_491]|nr:alpha/beta-hydrolase [Thozetella sp. PMI_491]
MTAKTMTEDLEHLRKHLKLDVLPVLLGGSHAGGIALRYAELYPSRVARLVLVAPQLMDEPPNTNFQDWFNARKDNPEYAPSIAALGKLKDSGPPSTDEEFREFTDAAMTWWFSDPLKADILRQHIAAGPTLPGFYAFQTNSHDRKPENSLPHIAEAGKVEAKTLVVWGEEDAILSVKAGHLLAEGIRDSKLVVIPGVGHFPYIENPGVFWAELEMFLSS